MGQRSYHHGDLKAALKSAVLALVCERGPRGFSLNEASRRAGVSVAAPYRHFEDKDALLAEVVCDGNAILERELRTAAKKPGTLDERIVEVGLAYVRFSQKHAEYFAVMFQSGIDKAKYPDIAASAAGAFAVIHEMAPERSVDLWALVHGLAALCSEGALEAAAGVKGRPALVRSILQRAISR